MYRGCKMINSTTCLKLQLSQLQRILTSGISTLTKSETRIKRNEIFDNEKKRQRASIGRIEKIEVKYSGPSDEVILVMNKNISTPYDCARHISEGVKNISALAEVDGIPWDMHTPLNKECNIKFLTTNAPNTNAVNKAFWRTCSMLLGAVAENSFKDNIAVNLHSFPAPNIRSGSFIHDVSIAFDNWEPTKAELQSLSAIFVKIVQSKITIERLIVKENIALDIFNDNPYKTAQIPDIAKHNNDNIVLYRIGDHIDISKGPMIANTGLIGRCTVASVHKLSTDEYGTLYRFQGIAIPNGIILNHFAYGILEDRAKKLNNCVWVPNKIVEDSEDHNIAAAVN